VSVGILILLLLVDPDKVTVTLVDPIGKATELFQLLPPAFKPDTFNDLCR
jgi:hypothetical protein